MMPTPTRPGIRLIIDENFDASNLLKLYSGDMCPALHYFASPMKPPSFQAYTLLFYQNLRKLSSSITLVILLSVMTL